VRLAVWVTPGRRQSEIAGPAGGELRVRVAAPPADGRANCELTLAVPRSAVTVVAGQGARHKVVQAGGVAPAEARRRLGLSADQPPPSARPRDSRSR
jgi:uncharacterized protein YggU (UPF0235/DUF167 family)